MAFRVYLYPAIRQSSVSTFREARRHDRSSLSQAIEVVRPPSLRAR